MNKEQIKARLKELEEDERLVRYDPANIMVNAPLALIQVELHTEANTLRKVLGLPARRYHSRD